MEENLAKASERLRLISSHLDKVTEDIKEIIPFFNLKDFYFAGGCIYSLWNDKEIKDYDIFCTNPLAIAKIGELIKEKKIKAFKTDNAYSIGKYQFIKQHIGQPYKEVGEFDFLHNCFWYDGELHERFGWKYLHTNKLYFNKERARNVLNIVTRIPKFIERGMTITQKEIVAIVELGTREENYEAERKDILNRHSGFGVY